MNYWTHECILIAWYLNFPKSILVRWRSVSSSSRSRPMVRVRLECCLGSSSCCLMSASRISWCRISCDLRSPRISCGLKSPRISSRISCDLISVCLCCCSWPLLKRIYFWETLIKKFIKQNLYFIMNWMKDPSLTTFGQFGHTTAVLYLTKYETFFLLPLGKETEL